MRSRAWWVTSALLVGCYQGGARDTDATEVGSVVQAASSGGRRRDAGADVRDSGVDVLDATADRADVLDATADRADALDVFDVLDVLDATADRADATDVFDVADATADRADATTVTDVADATADRADATAVIDASDAATGDVPAAPTTVGTAVAPALGQLTAAQVPTLTPSAGVRAFPGAEGFGASATGGRNGRVIYVTNLNASGPGSLTEALAASGPRYVLFKVSGFINASIRIAKGDVTIAGQSSPGGITVRGLITDEDTWCDNQCGVGVVGPDNIVVRHLRSRPGIPAATDGWIEPDGVRIRNSRYVVLDHVSAENAIDEALEISYSNNITVQDCLLGETLGDHADRGGLLMNYSNRAGGHELDAITVARTAWIRIAGRYPEMSREGESAGETMRVELANNLLWEQRYFIDSGHYNGISGDGDPVYYQLNWVGNAGFTEPTYPYGMLWFANPTGRSTVFFADNRTSRWPTYADWQLNYCCNDFALWPPPDKPTWAVASRHPFPAVNYIASSNVRAYAIAHAGAFPRDPMDRRLMSYVASGIIPSSAWNTNPADDARSNDWGTAMPAAPVDTDSDGMPDTWETARGLNPLVQDHNGTTVGAASPTLTGYTNLEVYLHELAEKRLTDGLWGR